MQPATAAAAAIDGAGDGCSVLQKSPLKEMLEEYRQYAQAASEMLLACAAAAAAGWVPSEPHLLDPEQALTTVEQLNDPYGLWRGVLGALVPPGVQVPEFPMTMTRLGSLDREQMDAMMVYNCETRKCNEGPSAELMRQAAQKVPLR
jgi:hypothetical protein